MEDHHRRGCEIIWHLWQSGGVIENLPPELRPMSRRDGYAIQAGLEAYSSSPRFGWKIAATSAAGQEHIGVDRPLAGRILAERVIENGATVSLDNNQMRVVEPEFAFTLAGDLLPREAQREVSDVLAAVADLHLCLELPDSRFENFAAVGGPSLIADNACARDLVVGEKVTEDWRSLDLVNHQVNAQVGTRYAREGVGRNVLGDPLLALTWLVNEISALGITLHQGELITTGTCAIPLEVEPGDEVVADFGLLGQISVSIAAW